jgi:alkylhydroperoxidase family enzyme
VSGEDILRLSVFAAALLLAGCMTTPAFSPRLSEPRLAPVDETDLTEAQRDMLDSRAPLNIYRTLANHVELYNRWSPLGQVLLNNTSISPRHRELAMLRMGWLCQSPYEWAQHARIAKASAGLTDAEVLAIAAAPDDTAIWSPIDRAVLKMADELRYDAMISDATWAELHKAYSDNQVMELLFTSAQYQLVSMALNTLGVQIEPTAVDLMPTGLETPAPATRPAVARLTAPRIVPLKPDAMTPEQYALVASRIEPEGSLMNLYGTLVTNPRLYGPRLRFGSYIQRDSLLDPETRELLILRTAWNIRAAYEWAHHAGPARTAGLSEAHLAAIAAGPSATIWTPKQRAVLQAADELRREAFITNATWSRLAEFFSMKERIEIVFTAGGYMMTGLAINSLGIQTEPGYPPLPN